MLPCRRQGERIEEVHYVSALWLRLVMATTVKAEVTLLKSLKSPKSW